MRTTGKRTIESPFDVDDYLTEVSQRFETILNEVSSHIELERKDRVNIRLALLDSINKELQKLNK